MEQSFGGNQTIEDVVLKVIAVFPLGIGPAMGVDCLCTIAL